ncbi:MAG: arsenate reductase [Burkholderiales bacterium]|jgi:arsenate reductase|uniref:Arsenate reductase n=1 Tax=Candidatus Desulfobacillus denitrificans TaxID=2608985 RepID=A0A809R368_9PROT|nr:arsenate reductase [Zoogloeaceae bacterium]MBP9654879.1 arsenate reductase [Rhodocyclaceae bacterium]MCZ2175052.1 arsenate reductase [Burkholderiales bacterium]OQY70267.1 MAG: arsenate reductase [Rhodocyclaceae bacterium UTPRO2]BBO21168.1 arsenate reductase [Candidatus Desulfobacillus denitrificans]GIK45818.1 MAG: arsenate reductase [Betaproteobacteria bacterium]
MTTVFGIKHCDTMKKAFAWLDSHGIAYEFHDYKKLGADAALLKKWAAQAGWEKLLNTRGPSFRRLPPEKQANLTEKKAFALMLENPSMIRRPIVEAGKALLIGFDPDEFAKKLK